MKDDEKSKEQLVRELADLRQRLAALEAWEAKRSQTEEQLTVFRRFAEASGQGLGMADLNGRITYVNPTLCRLIGEQKPEDVLGKSFAPYYPEQLRQKLAEEVIPTAIREGQWVGELALVTSKGGWTPTLENFFLIRDDQGSPLYLADVITDITQRKQAEEMLRQSEEMYRALVETSPDAVTVTDLEGHITYTSRRSLELFGFDLVEVLLGRSAFDFIAPEERQKAMTNSQKTLEEGVTRDLEYTLLHKDGTRFAGELSAAVMRDASGKPTALMAILRDVSQRNQAEEALRQSHEELQAIYDGMADGLLIAEIASKRLVRANLAICRMLGYRQEELLTMSAMDVHPAGQWPEVLADFQAQAEGRLVLSESCPMLRKDGSVFYADITSNPITYNGQPCLIGFFRDITERKRAEEAIQKEQQVLRQLLKSQDRERQLIAYEIHDGLAQQLTAATMQFQIFDSLKAQNPGEASKAHQQGMEMLRQGLAETRRLIGGLRPPILDEWGIVAALEHLVSDTREQGGPEIEFQSNVEFQRLEPLLENAIFRIVQEGLTNARRHSKSDRLRIALLQRGDRVRIEIQDRGIGFEPQKVANVGFGLEGIRERARLVGGRAVIQSAPGKGTHILVELPLAEK